MYINNFYNCIYNNKVKYIHNKLYYNTLYKSLKMAW